MPLDWSSIGRLAGSIRVDRGVALSAVDLFHLSATVELLMCLRIGSPCAGSFKATPVFNISTFMYMSPKYLIKI